MRWYRRSVAYVAPEGAEYEAVRRHLEDLGLECRHVHTTSAAESLVLDRVVDCVVVDAVEDRDVDGVLEEVRRTDELLPIVLYPTAGSEALAARAVALEVDAYVPREEGPEGLTDALREVLSSLEDPRRDARGMLDTIMEMIPRNVDIYFKGVHGRHVDVSDGFPEMVGPPYMVTPDDKRIHASEDLHGMTDFDLYGDDVGEQTREDERRIMETGEPVVDQLEETVSPDGQYVAVASTKAPWYDSAGRLRGVVGVTIDETDRERQRRAVERENERLERFAGVLSHDLRNPLSIAKGRIEELDGDPGTLEDLEWALDRIDELVTDVLELARQGAAVDEAEPLELADPIREAWATVEIDGELVVEDPPRVSGDEERLRALFENLYRNAAEHAGADATVRVARHDSGFTVEDDGPGIPEEDRDRVLEHGYSTQENGTGLGLAIVNEIVEAHGWEVHVEESDLGGAAFVVELDPEE